MIVKLFEVRDRMTFIPVMAVRLTAFRYSQDEWLLRRAGYAQEQIETPLPEGFEPYVLFTRLDGGGKCHCDPYDWYGSRTFAVAHLHIIQNWETLTSGDVIDVEFTLGETKAPKVSERSAT